MSAILVGRLRSDASVRGARQSRGRVQLAGIALSAPSWWDEVDAWCEVVGLDPPGGSGGRLGVARRRALSVTFVDEPDHGGGLAWLVATTDNLDLALQRASSRGAQVLEAPSQGQRRAVVKGPHGINVQIVEVVPRTRLAGFADQAPRRAEAHLRATTVANTLAAFVITGYTSWLSVQHAPRHQVSFGFLVGFCSLFAALAVVQGYPSGLVSGEDSHGQGSVRALRSEAAGTDPDDVVSKPWERWVRGAAGSALAGAVSALVLGLASFGLLGRPVGVWLLWAWSAALGGTTMVVGNVYGVRRGVLLAGRRAHGLAVSSDGPHGLVRRAWLMGAVPFGVLAGVVNSGLAWSAYRYTVSTKTLGSNLLGSVVITAAVAYLYGRQWGRADWRARRVEVPAEMHLPAKVRLGPQGLLFAIVGELIALSVIGHGVPHPPPVAAAVLMRAFAGLVSGVAGFGLGAVAGVLNTAAGEAEQ